VVKVFFEPLPRWFLWLILVIAGCGSVQKRGDLPLPGTEVLLEGKEKPGWLKSGGLSGHFIGISKPFSNESEARTDATRDARKKIVESLGLKLKSSVVEQLLDKGEGAASDIVDTDVLTRAKVKAVAGSLIKVRANRYFVQRWQRWQEKGVDYFWKVYVQVKFDQQSHDRFITDLVKHTLNFSEQMLGRARKQWAAGEVSASMQLYLQLLKTAEEFNSYTSLSPKQMGEVKKYVFSVREDVAKLYGKISITLENDGQSVISGQGLKKPLIVKARLKDNQNGRDMPLAGLPLKFYLAKGQAQIDQSAVTGENGKAFCRVYKTSANHKNYLVKGEVDLGLGDIPPPTFSFSFSASKGRVLVKLDEVVFEKVIKTADIESRLIRQLLARGLEVKTGRKLAGLALDPDDRVEKAVKMGKKFGMDVVIYGHSKIWISSRDPLGPGTYGVRLSLRLQAVEVISGKTVCEISIPNQRHSNLKGFGTNKKGAVWGSQGILKRLERSQVLKEVALEIEKRIAGG